MAEINDSGMTLAHDGDAVTRVSRLDGVAAWRQITDALEAEIAEERLASGTQLPTEAALADRFGVNRHTVRRALAVLATRGLVRATRGRGTFVELRPLAYPIGSRTRFSEIVSGAGREPGGRLIDAATIAATAAIAEALAIREGDTVLRLVTLRSADGVPVSYATSCMPLPRFAGIERLVPDGLSIALARYGVGAYRRATTRITARPASAEAARHLELAPDRSVLVVDSVNVDADGRPIQATTALMAADRVEIRVET